MTGLERAIDQYVGLRRRLGFRLAIQRGILYRFAKFAAKEKASVVTTDLVLRWVSGMIDVLPATAARSFSVVRQFAVWWKARDPRTQIPPARLVARRYQRRVPFLHTAHQLRRLLTAAKRLESKNGIRGLTYSTLFGLIAAAGLRISEAVNLDGADVNLAEGVLTIRGTKFGKTRLVPLHPSTTSALAKYAARRDRIMANVRSPAFFLSERGRRVTDWSTRYNFAHVSQQVGDRPSQRGSAGPRRSRYRHGCGPRLHDLRHRFAAETLLAWYRAGSDVERELPKLATYLGHVKMEHTYWYIEAVPELLQLAVDRHNRDVGMMAQVVEPDLPDLAHGEQLEVALGAAVRVGVRGWFVVAAALAAALVDVGQPGRSWQGARRG
jgi:integrase/recombinase XerD